MYIMKNYAIGYCDYDDCQTWEYVEFDALGEERERHTFTKDKAEKYIDNYGLQLISPIQLHRLRNTGDINI